MASSARSVAMERGDRVAPHMSKSESLLACILENASVSMLCVDSGLGIVLAGRNWRARCEERGRDTHDLHRAFAESAERDELEELARGVFRTRKPVVGPRLQDDRRHYEYGIIPFVWQGEVVYAIIVLRDITEELRLGEEVRAAERRLTSIVESASDIVVSLDLSGRIVTWNTAARKLTGLSIRDVAERTLAELCTEDSAKAMSQAIAKVHTTKRVVRMRLSLQGEAGEARTVDWAFSAMTDEAETVSGIVAVGRDLTEQLEAQARLHQADRLTALGVMAGGIAHEVRNPLAVSSSAAQLLLKHPLDKTTQLECAEKIHSGIVRASQIIENLLRFARPSDSAVNSVVDTTRVIRDALKLVENQRKLAKIKLRLSLKEKGATVLANPTLLQQAFMNLMLNGINAMRDGGVLSVKSAREKDEVLVQVSDSGTGIASSDVGKVFDPFFTRMPVGKGSGLGLSITYSIVEQYGGDIAINSTEGRGTTVVVTLPWAKG